MHKKLENPIDTTKITYPDNLPVSALKNTIKTTIDENQITIISGSTGSGKTTQIPKICLELGRGQKGLIGHTQPRRLAARTVASRIAQELKVPLGEQVGYQIRFTDETNINTQVKLMTDGILLNEIQTDPLLKKYDTLIIDEAHERSLNIDFILGYLSTLKTKRPDLKIIITSATIDSQKFAKHFATNGKNAPIIEVSGRTYPVEIRYRPLINQKDTPQNPNKPNKLEEEIDQISGIINACDELIQSGRGDILVFLAGEKDIRDTQNALEDYYGQKCEILPVFSRQSNSQQMKIFKPNHTKTRIVLATNIAETSLTVPGIRYVIDPGLARISRYSNRTKVQRLPIEPISQASANQRSGRCGRVQDGIAIRLYSEEDYLNRPEYTQPEILRTSLASVILKMVSIGLKDIENFPFIDKPDTKSLKNGLQQLKEIGAFKTVEPQKTQNKTQQTELENKTKSIVGNHKITKLGLKIAKMPIDPRLARILLEADKNGCLNEVIVIVAALSMQDVRERPLEQEEISDQYHSRFNASTSDFLTYLTLWRYLQVQSKRLSGSAFRRMCKNEFFHYLRVREWVDIVNQIIEITQNLGLKSDKLTLPELPKKLESTKNNDEIASLCVSYGKSKDTPDSDQIHCSLLVGLLSNIGYYDQRKNDYQGTRGSRFTIWPGSGLYGSKHEWIMSAEIVETSRVFARTVAKINPEWIEKYGRYLIKYNYSDPTWSKKSAATLVKEKVLLYGLPIISDRTVLLGRLQNIEFDGISAKEYARESFIMNALVLGQWTTYHKFYKTNETRLRQAQETQNRQRDFSLIVDEQDIFDFYDEKLPDNIISAKHFDSWWKNQPDKTILNFDNKFLYKGELADSTYPKFFHTQNQKLELKYIFNPQSERDGITVKIPADSIYSLKPEPFEWLVEGILEELVYNILKNLPKNIRKHLVPIPDFTKQLIDFFHTTPENLNPQNPQNNKKIDTEEIIDITGKLKNFTGKLDDFKDLHRQLLDQTIIDNKNQKPTPTIQTNTTNQTTSTQVQTTNFYKNNAMFDAFQKGINYLKNIEITFEQWQEATTKLPKHLIMNFRVVNDKGSTICEGRNLNNIKNTLLERKATQKLKQIQEKNDNYEQNKNNEQQIIQTQLQKICEKFEIETTQITKYPEKFDPTHIKHENQFLYPTLTTHTQIPLIDTNDLLSPTNIYSNQNIKTVINELFDQNTHLQFGPVSNTNSEKQIELAIVTNKKLQEWLHLNTITYLFTQNLQLPTKRITTRWTGKEATILALNPYKTLENFVTDAQFLAVKTLQNEYINQNRITESTFTNEQLKQLYTHIQNNLEDKTYEILKTCVEIFQTHKTLNEELKRTNNILLLQTIAEIKTDTQNLITEGFLRNNEWENIQRFTKYIESNHYRLLKAKQNPAQDQTLQWKLQSQKDKIKTYLKTNTEKLLKTQKNYENLYKTLLEIKYLIEEYKISLFAQHIGTITKVSDKRIMKFLEETINSIN